MIGGRRTHSVPVLLLVVIGGRRTHSVSALLLVAGVFSAPDEDECVGAPAAVRPRLPAPNGVGRRRTGRCRRRSAIQALRPRPPALQEVT